MSRIIQRKIRNDRLRVKVLESRKANRARERRARTAQTSAPARGTQNLQILAELEVTQVVF